MDFEVFENRAPHLSIHQTDFFLSSAKRFCGAAAPLFMGMKQAEVCLRRLPPCRPSSTSSHSPKSPSRLPFRFETGVGLFAKRASRPFPPPFYSPPSGSFSDPLSTHHQSRDRRLILNGTVIKGLTNGDDAVYASERFICANDGVGAWSTRPRGHAGYGDFFC